MTGATGAALVALGGGAAIAGSILAGRGLRAWARGAGRQPADARTRALLERTWTPLVTVIPAATLATATLAGAGDPATPGLRAAIGVPILAGVLATAWHGVRRPVDAALGAPRRTATSGTAAAAVRTRRTFGGGLAGTAVLPVLAGVILLLVARLGRIEVVPGQLLVAIVATSLWVLAAPARPAGGGTADAAGSPSPPPGTGGLLAAVVGAVVVGAGLLVLDAGRPTEDAGPLVGGVLAAVITAITGGLAAGLAACAMVPAGRGDRPEVAETPRIPAGAPASTATGAQDVDPPAEHALAPLRAGALGALAAAGTASTMLAIAVVGGRALPGPAVAGGLGPIAWEATALLVAGLLHLDASATAPRVRGAGRRLAWGGLGLAALAITTWRVVDVL